jgi:hypothetical protein
MAEYKEDGEEVEVCLVEETPSPSFWKKESMQACISIRIDETQVMHAITLITNTAILIQTGVRHDWDFAVSQKETRNDVTLRDFPLTIALPTEYRRLYVTRIIRLLYCHTSLPYRCYHVEMLGKADSRPLEYVVFLLQLRQCMLCRNGGALPKNILQVLDYCLQHCNCNMYGRECIWTNLPGRWCSGLPICLF